MIHIWGQIGTHFQTLAILVMQYKVGTSNLMNNNVWNFTFQLSLLQLQLIVTSLQGLIIRLQAAILCLHPLIGREERPEVVFESGMLRPEIGQRPGVCAKRLALQIQFLALAKKVFLVFADRQGFRLKKQNGFELRARTQCY